VQATAHLKSTFVTLARKLSSLALVSYDCTDAWGSVRWYVESKPRTFSEGDLVRVCYPRKVTGRSPKWQSFYRTEGKIIKKLNDVTFVVQSMTWRGTKVVHIDKLKPINSFS